MPSLGQLGRYANEDSCRLRMKPMGTASRILCAGCSYVNVDLLFAAVSNLNCRVETVDNGTECLTQLQRFQPHLVLIDTAIADPDAFQLCRRIKSDHTAMVVIVTALNELGDIERAVDAGTDDFVSKPINKNELRKRVENMLKLQ